MKRYFSTISPSLLYILILVLVFLAHTSYINNGFVWLDHGDIEDGRTILPLTEAPLMFVIRFGDTAFYRPLVTLANSTDFFVYKAFVSGYHLTNIFLHIAVTAAVPLFLSVFFTFSFVEMLLAMLIVGLHPLSWLPVGAIAYRPELFFTLFTLLTVYFHAKAQTTKKELFRIAAVASFFLALISKETAIVMVPALILLWEYRQKHKNKPSYHLDKKWRWTLYISEAVILIIYLMLRDRAIPEVWNVPYTQLSFSDAVGTRLYVLAKLLFDFINPLKPHLSDAITIVSIFSLIPLITLLLVSLLLIISAKVTKQSSWKIAIILFLLMLTPALDIIPVPRIGSSHYGYFPLVGFAALIVLVLRRFRSYIFISLLGIWLLMMSITTFLGGFHFHNDYTLFQPEVTADPRFLEGYFYLGDYYLRKGDFKNAEKEYMKSLHINPKVIAYSDNQSTLINLASAYLEENKLDKADDALSLAESISLKKNGQALFHNIILLAYKKHDYKKVVDLSQDDRVFPYSATTFIIVADSLHHVGRNEEAIALLHSPMPPMTKEQQMQIKKMLKSFRK